MGPLFVLSQGANAALRSPSQETVLQKFVLPRQFTSIRTLNISRGASLDREKSSLSCPNLDQELKELKVDRVAMRPQLANDKYLRETASGDGDTHLVEFSDALQTVAKALREVAEGKARALDEAAQWKRRFEMERLRNAHLENLAAAYASRDSFRQEEALDLQIPETDALEPRAFIERLQSNLSCYSKEGIYNQEVIRSRSSSLKNPSSDLLLDERVYPEKALFTLKWGSTGVKSTKHKHDIVSFESGDITTAVRTNKQITLVWDSPPQSVFILSKPNASTVQNLCKEMVRWLKEEKGIRVYVEPIVKAELLKDSSYYDFVQTCKSEEEVLDLHNKVDLVITLGGDGTVLWAASMFKGSVPPIVSFSMGSLGFMTQFQSDRFRECLQTVLKGPVYITLRHRLHCQIVLHPDNMKGDCLSEPEEHLVLNEVSIDRGMSSFLTNLECYCDGLFVTVVQGDGLILSTPSGSTAYSLAAGGSMVHPQVPGILFTPICPHSLSFRPLILPEYVTLRIQVPVSSRGQAWASFDGKARQPLSGGDALIVRMSAWPVPAACEQESSNDFLRSVREGLHWNLRKSQLSDGPQNSN